MIQRHWGWCWRACLLSALAAAGCASAVPASDAGPCLVNRRPPPDSSAATAIRDVDLLLAIDNSFTAHHQSRLMAAVDTLIEQLRAPHCVSDARPEPHPCDPSDPTDRPDGRRLDSLHVGVVSSDLGTPGSSVPGCVNSDLGDDGLLNPIRYGQALRQHPPFTAPAGFRPADCTDPNQFPSFIAFDSMRASEPGYVANFAHDVRCNAGLYVSGCGLEQQLESVWRALVWHDASETPGNASSNAGFLRESALLAILMLTDEDDGSVRDCRFARGEPCEPAIDVYDASSTRWASEGLNLRFYLYQPGGPRDPTWPLDRYVDPANPTRGLLALKPGHPERIVFGALTGVPRAVPTRADGTTDWDALLGAPGGSGPNDFALRDSRTAVDAMSAEGPVSMRQANADPNCRDRVVPACRQEGTTYDPARPPCALTEQPFAWPARRIVEIARRFDEAPLCAGQPCRNGLVASVCDLDYRPAVRAFAQRVRQNLVPACLPRVLPVLRDEVGHERVDCTVVEWTPTEPGTAAQCDAQRGRQPIASLAPQMVNGRLAQPCEIAQVRTDPARGDAPIPGGVGWYYARLRDARPGQCRQSIAFTPGAHPAAGVVARMECFDRSPPGCMP